MITKRVVLYSLIAICIAWVSYWFNFSYLNSFQISNRPEVWGAFGDFLGGVLNPFLTFLTIVLLVSSLQLQRQANEDLKDDMARGEYFERLRSFESYFFNMIDSQKVLFNNFKLPIKKGNDREFLYSSVAVSELEDVMLELKKEKVTETIMRNVVERYDQNDEIYSMIRTFCLIVKTIDGKLSDNNGFSSRLRKEYYETLINFTDYSLIRLVLISYKYNDYSILDSLRNSEFESVVEKLGLLEYSEKI